MAFMLETKMHTRFDLLRLLEGRLVSSQCELAVEIDIPAGTNHRMAKQRLKAMRFWLDQLVDGAVAFNVQTDIDTTFLEQVSNNVMMCPDEPHDYLILCLLHSKMQAIAADDITVGSTMLMSDCNEGFTNTLHGHANDVLPSMEEWIGKRSFHDLPWWKRADTSTLDMKPMDDDDLSVIPDIGKDILELVSDPCGESENPEPTQPAEIIRARFKPRLVDATD